MIKKWMLTIVLTFSLLCGSMLQAYAAGPGTGYFCDMQGNLYYMDDGGQLYSEKNSYGVSFDENGIMQNPAAVDIHTQRELAERFEAGETLIFADVESYCNFFEYYTSCYRLLDDELDLSFIVYDDGSIELTIPQSARYDRAAIRNQILQIFGTVSGDTVKAKIENACQAVAQKMSYDSAYVSVNMPEAIAAGRGVCWHMSKITHVLLEEAGVYVEMMSGLYGGESHSWLRCWGDGRYIYVDPTQWAAGDSTAIDIPYSTFLAKYVPVLQTTIVLDPAEKTS
ncbi:MAG: transglutaminase-like domain-containing protein [Clostridiales bacterium]|nr:transglutaminase-like domain-containing protein [Clostridiales bacterium]